MFQSLKYSSVLKSKRAAGVEVVFLPDGNLQLNGVVLKKSKNSLEVEVTHTGIKDFETLQKALDSKFPVNIVMNGKGIIHRKVTINEGENDAKLLEKVFPNAQLNDFYLQRTALSANIVFISLVRKSMIDPLLENFIHKGYYFSGISLGPFCLNAVIPLMNLLSDQLSLGNYHLTIHPDDHIEDFQDNGIHLSGEKITIAGEALNQQNAISFAAAFQYFLPQPEEASISVPIVDLSKKELEQKKLFHAGGWCVLLLFLTVLLSNFLLFDYYGKQYQQLDIAFSGNKGQWASINEMKIKVKEKKAFLEKTGLKGASKTSYYADRTLLDLPETIQLTQLFIYPPEKKTKNDEPVIFLNKVILIKGNCRKSTTLNEWIRTLKKKEWISDVAVLSYKQENVNDPGEFEIKITIT